MALTLKDVLRLNVMQNMTVITGSKAMDRPVTSLGIGDYEFASFSDKKELDVFEPNMVVLSNLLFAKYEPELIYSCVDFLSGIGAAALFYRSSVFKELPDEALKLAEDRDFAIIRYDDTYMEQIIFEVLDAIRAEEDDLFTEEKVDRIIREGLSRDGIYSLIKGMSLELKDYVQAVYISSKDAAFRNGFGRYLKEVYLNGNLRSRLILFEYRSGLFGIMTSRHSDRASFSTIFDMLKGYLSLDRFDDIRISLSSIYDPYDALDTVIRESYFTYLASEAESKEFTSYESIGLYRLLLPLKGNRDLRDHMSWIMDKIRAHDDYPETFEMWVRCGGDISVTAKELHCHHNTVRYRIARLKEELGLNEMSDTDFYSEVSLAVRTYLIYRLDSEQ